jgi:hypothetical protein
MLTFERVEIEVARVTRAMERGDYDAARAMATAFMDRIGAQVAVFPAVVARMKAVAAGSRDVASGDL